MSILRANAAKPSLLFIGNRLGRLHHRHYSSNLSQTDAILDRALPDVPRLGWSDALIASIRESGLSDQATSIFADGPLDLVSYFHRKQLSQLASADIPEGLSFAEALRRYTNARLRMNEALGGVGLGAAIKLLAAPKNLAKAVQLLTEVSDEIIYLAGDRSTDSRWYARRAIFSGIYASAETVMSRDKSTGFKATYAFVDEQLAAMNSLEEAVHNTNEWLLFNAHAGYNIGRSLLR